MITLPGVAPPCIPASMGSSYKRELLLMIFTFTTRQCCRSTLSCPIRIRLSIRMLIQIRILKEYALCQTSEEGTTHKLKAVLRIRSGWISIILPDPVPYPWSDPTLFTISIYFLQFYTNTKKWSENWLPYIQIKNISNASSLALVLSCMVHLNRFGLVLE
jgi:hypothetical protein